MNDTVTLPTPTVTNEQLALVSRTIAKDLTPDELALYLHMCANEWGIHPLSKMVFPIKYGGKMTFVSSIDYLRARAAATGEHAGTDDATFPDGDEATPPAWATVTVYRIIRGVRCPFTATARWKEYLPASNGMWLRMPRTMISKCAEGLALRKAFPAELAKLYVAEEMAQAERVVSPMPTSQPIPPPMSPPAPYPTKTTPPPPPTPQAADATPSSPSIRYVTAPQLKRLHVIRERAGVSDGVLHTYLTSAHGITSVSEIPMSRYDTVIAWLENGGR